MEFTIKGIKKEIEALTRQRDLSMAAYDGGLQILNQQLNALMSARTEQQPATDKDVVPTDE